MVYLEHSDILKFDEEKHPNAQLLKGNVCFRHDDALMYCDSAYYYEKNNSLDAFGHVRLNQGDTLQGFSERMYYDGNTKIARMRQNVRLLHYNTLLTTDSLNYNRQADLAYYFGGGQINDSTSTLTSYWGQYTPPTKQAMFKTDVRLCGEQFTLDSDTLLYNTNTHIAKIVSPAVILYEEETTILTSNGWHNTEQNQIMMYDRSLIWHHDGTTLTGDSIFYDKNYGKALLWQNIEVVDSTEQATLNGHYSEFYENEEWGFVTDSALVTLWNDSLNTYIHADTIYSEQQKSKWMSIVKHDNTLADSVLTTKQDTLWSDTTFNRLRCFRHVRLFRDDLQAVGDSLVYLEKDSMLRCYGQPIMWMDNQQVAADSILVYLANEEVEHAEGLGNAFACQQQTAEFFNQMSGKEIIAYLDSGEIRQIYVKGNAETVYYPKEDDGTFTGVNKTQSSFVRIFIENEEIKRMLFTTATTGTMYPLKDMPAAKANLSAFFWANEERPTDKDDVFRIVEHAQRKATVVSATSEQDEDEKAAKEKKEKEKRKKSSQGGLKSK